MIPSLRHRDDLVPADEISARIRLLQQTLQEKGVGAAWIEHITDRFYFSGSAQDGVLLVPAHGDPRFFVKKSKKRADAESSLDVVPFPGTAKLVDAVHDFAGSDKKLGMALDVTAASTYLKLAAALGDITIADIAWQIRLQRATKSEWEIGCIERASAQATAIFENIEQYVREGIPEVEVSAAIEHDLRIMGHSGVVRIRRLGLELAMLTVAGGDAALYPTNFDGPVGGEGTSPFTAPGAGRRITANGETVMVDIVTGHNGYNADTARTFAIGSFNDLAADAHRFCLDTIAQLEKRMRPGAVCADMFNEVMDWAKAQNPPEGFLGYEENRTKFFGHGVGIELDELPIIADRVNIELRAGMVLAVEPKAFLPGIGPVGAEDTFVITEDGCRPLCPITRDIRVI